MDDVCGLPSGGSVRIAARALPPEGAPATLPARVVVTEPAAQLIRELVERHGPVMFHQSGGCCDGSAPMCYPDGEFRVGQRDVLVGEVDLAPGARDVPAGDDDEERLSSSSSSTRVRVWISGPQFDTWKHTQLVLDAVPGRGSGFSLENPTGKRFLSRARTFDELELAALEEFPPATGADPGV
ncbi:DUF779 domain-containing protein [Dietzia sp. oral taxon 368]|uniref:DUF779 domain-containing protein n=1 Tax=Dietzia sp. oral taxon 368 TaxID=712270 RepID=UPI000D094C05|nr:DUF779 domain-containing protein [Dietzia sp. oral taxon 368]AVM64232.1 DUF779 domain-containing protein [Dietzia sp. oral taxon 368]